MNFKKYILLFLVIVYLLSLSFAKDCGGNILCECGDRLVEDYTLQQDLVCLNSSKSLQISSGNLYCDGFTLVGNNSLGIQITGKKNIKISNCNFENFSKAVTIESFYRYERAYTYAPLKKVEYPSENIQIFNSTFKNNTIGIYSKNSREDLIEGNKFMSSSLQLNSQSFRVYLNEFYNSNLYFSSTSQKLFCEEGLENYFDKTSFGPKCDCIKPLSGLIIDSEVTFCSGEYILNSPLRLKSGANISCENTILNGNGSQRAFYLEGDRAKEVSGCTIKNYSQGFYLTNNYYLKTNWNIKKYDPSHIQKVSNLRFEDVGTAFYFTWRTAAGDSYIPFLENISFKNTQKYIHNPLTKPLLLNNSCSFKSSYALDKISNTALVTGLETFSQCRKENLTFTLKDYSLTRNQLQLNFSSNLALEKQEQKTAWFYLLENNSFVSKENFTLNFSSGKHKFSFVYAFNESFDEVIINIEAMKVFSLKQNSFSFTYEGDFDFLEEEFNSFSKELYQKNELEGTLSISKLSKKRSLLEKLRYSSQAKITLAVQNDSSLNISIQAENLLGELSALRFLSLQDKDFFIFSKEMVLDYSHPSSMFTFEYFVVGDTIGYFKTKTEYFLTQVKIFLTQPLLVKELSFLPVSFENSTYNYSLTKYQLNVTQNYLNYSDNKVLVFGAGLFSNKSSFKTFATKFAQLGFTTYIIELTGNTQLELKESFTYDLEFLAKEVFPSYLEEISLRENSSVIYIGHSNGARVALDAYTFMNHSPISHLIALGVPGAFEDKSILAQLLGRNKEVFETNLENISHVSMSEVTSNLRSSSKSSLTNSAYFTLSKLAKTMGQQQISTNLFLDYVTWMNSSLDDQPGSDVTSNKFSLFAGDYFFMNHDLIVSLEDEQQIFNNVKSQSRTMLVDSVSHIEMTQSDIVFSFIRGEVNE